MGFRIPWAVFPSPKPGMADSTRKNFKDSRIRIPLFGLGTFVYEWILWIAWMNLSLRISQLDGRKTLPCQVMRHARDTRLNKSNNGKSPFFSGFFRKASKILREVSKGKQRRSKIINVFSNWGVWIEHPWKGRSLSQKPVVLLLKVVNYVTFFCVTFFLGTLFTFH